MIRRPPRSTRTEHTLSLHDALPIFDPSDGLLLDITDCAHLFGGETSLLDDVEARLVRLGMTVRAALAASPDAARALARFQLVPAHDEDAAIRRLPVAALQLEAETETARRRAGLKTIAALAEIGRGACRGK